ncbi:MAG: YdcF family protein [Allobaculum sp.]
MKRKHTPSTRTKFWLRLAAVIGAGTLIYEHYLPKTRKPKDTPYEYGLVLGCAAHDDGTLSHAQIGRCQLALDEYEKGQFKTLILSGSNVKNEYVEAKVMADWIHEHNPELPMLLETNARNTWENLKFVRQMVGDVPIEIMTGQLHARRASAIAANFFTNYCVASYPDFKFKRFALEIRSRFIYCLLELKKSLLPFTVK